MTGTFGYRWFAGLGGRSPFNKQLPAKEVDDTLYKQFLVEVWRPGGIDYDTALQHRGLLDQFLDQIGKAQPGNLNQQEQLSYLLNTYNALVLKSVMDAWPIQSIEEVGPFHAFFRQRKHVIAGQKVSLHALETQWLQPISPYIHFGLNCASISCPPLKNEPYKAQNVMQQLEGQAKLFLGNSQLNYHRNGVWYLSEIFDWYEDDFGGQKGVIDFVQNHTDWSRPKEIRFLTYDWSLNHVNVPLDSSPTP